MVTKRYWLTAGLIVLWLVARIFLGNKLPLFGDEAFYWLESQNLAWGYSDLPPLSAWLVAAGEWLWGHHYLAVRFFFLAMGTAVPGLVFLLARRAGLGTDGAIQAGVWSILIPLASIIGILALPDVPLIFFGLSSLLLLMAAFEGNHMRSWLGLGLALALGLLSHYRFLPVLLAGGGFVVFTREGRRMLGNPGLWLALALAMVGLIPTVYSSMVLQLGSLDFQLSERNPWSFQALGLLQVPVQMLIVTPVLFALLAIGAFRLVGAVKATHKMIAWFSLLPLLVYWGLGLWADQSRTSFHWPLLSFLPLLIVIPLFWHSGSATLLAWARYPALAGVVFLFTTLAALTLPVGKVDLPINKTGLGNFFAWPEVAEKTRAQLDKSDYEVLVVDNFMLAAELMFELDAKQEYCDENQPETVLCLSGRGGNPGIPILILDHPRNHKHGRARQIKFWQMLAAPRTEQRILYAFEDLASDNGVGERLLEQACIVGTAVTALPDANFIHSEKRVSYYQRIPAEQTVCDRFE